MKERKGVLGLQISDLKKKDSNQEQSQVPEDVSGRHHLPLKSLQSLPPQSGGQPGPGWSPSPEGQHLSKPCRALVFPALLPTPSPAPGHPAEGPRTPSEVEAAWVEQGRGGQGPGRAHCSEKEELTSAPGRAPPPPPGFLLLGRPEGTWSTLFGD